MPAVPLEDWLQRVGATTAFEALASVSNDAAVFAVDEERNVVFFSPGAERLLGFSRDEVLGEHCLKSNRCQQCMRGCGIAEHGRVTDVPLTLYRSDGQPVRVKKSGRAFFDRAGRFIGGVERLTPLARPEPSPPSDERPLGRARAFHGLVTGDPSMQAAFQIIRNVAETDTTVLVRGESGSGKELVARAIHAESHRAGGPFLAVNCAALTPSLLESELFGHVKGAFTGAVSDRRGLFEQADHGTLFLDEVAELPLDVQAKLLRVLEEKHVVPLGGTDPIPVDVRIVAATHRSLRQEVKAGRFREDLMYRLRVVPLFLPPLRDRREDVELLVRHFTELFNARGGRNVERIAPEAMRALLEHRWPGNVRELKNVLEYAFAVGRGPEIALAELPPELSQAAPRSERVDEARRIAQALEETGGQVGKAAELLGMSRATFWRKRRKHGL